MTDPSNVVTTDNINSFNAAIAKVDKSLQVLKTKAGTVKYFQDVLGELTKQREGLVKRIEKMRGEIGALSRTDPSVANLIKELTAYGKRADQESKKQPSMRYMFGNSRVANVGALEAKVKAELPQKAKNCASGALNDAVKGDAKDASKFGTGLRHASAGKKNVKGESCTVFFTRQDVDGGLETVLTVQAVGSHSGPASYDIHKSFVTTLGEGKSVSL